MQRFLGFLLALVLFFSFVKQSFATQYSLIPPSGDLVRGQTIQFTINIDTENTSVTTSQIGLTYDTAAISYLSAVPGNTMTSVSVSDLGGGKLLFTGTNSSGFTGTGVFAYINFQIIATSAGSTELCTLWAPTEDIPVSTNAPTALPRTGSINNASLIGIIGAVFVTASTGLYFISNKKTIPPKHHHKPKNHV